MDQELIMINNRLIDEALLWIDEHCVNYSSYTHDKENTNDIVVLHLWISFILARSFCHCYKNVNTCFCWKKGLL